jgi:hypothetical protein
MKIYVACRTRTNWVENYLHAEVCSGSLALGQVQREIAEDWYRMYQASVPH